MRIPSGTTDRYIYFVAVDATDLKTRETGLSTWTVYRSRNGGAATAWTTPTINETSSSNMPGVYELLIDEDTTLDAGNDAQEMVIHITHAGMAPVTRSIEIYRPETTEGNTAAVDASGRIDVGKWLGTAAATPTVAGVPEVDVTHWLGSAADAPVTVSDILSDGIALNTTSGTLNTVTTVNALGTQAKSDVNAEVLDVLNVDTFAEITAVPAIATTMSQMMRLMYQLARNKVAENSATETQTIYQDDDSTVFAQASVSTSGTTTTRGKLATA